MAIEINHLFESNVPDGEDNNLVQPSDWNANHVLSGGGLFRFPQLIEEKVLEAGTTTTTFSNLDGDVDAEYLVLIDVNVTQSSGEPMIRCFPNNDTGANYSNVVDRYASGWGTAVNWGSPYPIVAYKGASSSGRLVSETRILPKTGVKRYFMSMVHADNVWGNLDFYWTNTASNITSLVFTITGGTMAGSIKLYKMVDFNLGGS